MLVGRGVMESQGVALARVDELAVEELGDELLIYDLRSDHAHCLSAVAARVWRACDGRTSDAALASKLGIQADELERALDELASCELLEASVVPAADGLSRRELTVRFATGAAAAAAAPLIVSIVAPTAAAQGTPIPGCEDVGGCTQDCGGRCTQVGVPGGQSACNCCNYPSRPCRPGIPCSIASGAHFCVLVGQTCPECPPGCSTLCPQTQQDSTQQQRTTTTQETTTTTTPETTTTTTPTTTTPETTTSTTPTTPETTTGSSSVAPPPAE